MIPVTDEFFVDIEAAIVEVDVPLLMGLDVLVSLKVILDFYKCIMTSKIDGLMTPLISKLGHAYIEWIPHIM